jgi:hypothetical protein
VAKSGDGYRGIKMKYQNVEKAKELHERIGSTKRKLSTTTALIDGINNEGPPFSNTFKEILRKNYEYELAVLIALEQYYRDERAKIVAEYEALE